jgi:hypothetical protein
MRAALLAFLLVAPALAATAGAQVPLVNATLSVAVDDPGHALVPGKNETLDVHVTYSPQAGAQAAPGQNPDPNDPLNDNSSRKTRITFTIKTAPAWITNFTFEPPTIELPVTAGTGGGVATNAKLIVQIDPKAPALQKELLVITAKAEANGNVKEASQDSPEIKVKPAFIPKINITAPDAMVVPGGRWTELPYTLKNLGNAETKVKLNVTARPQDSEVEYDDTATVPLNGSTIVNVRLRLPWTASEAGTVELEATPLPLSDTDAPGRPVHEDIDVQGLSAVPGADAALVAAGALVAIAIRSRRAR